MIRNPKGRAAGAALSFFFRSVIVAVVAKLWLTSQIRIAPVFADHDAENYVEHARDLLAGAWFGGYTDLTLIKEPMYPIYLALVQEIGLTLPLANFLLYAGACAIACLAVRPLVRNGAVLASIFAVLLFNPMTYAWEAWMASRSELNASLALLATACAAGILVRRHAPLRELLAWWLGLGVSFAAFWLTREEALWLVPCLLVLAAAYVFSIRRAPDMRVKLAGLAIPLVIWILSGAAIAKMNESVYGWNTVVEVKAPEFIAAYNSLARIVPVKEEALISVPRSSREIAYRVSPAARELQPALEGQLGATWTDVVCKQPAHICNDIAGSYFVWAFRDAVALAGHYRSGGEARDYYVRLASEIDKACDSGAIACRQKAWSIFPNPTAAQVPAIYANVREAVVLLTSLAYFSTAHVSAAPDPVLDAKYAYITGALTVDRYGYKGSLMTDRPMRVTLEGPGGPVSFDGAMRMPSDDIARHAGWDDRNARFSFVTDCWTGCFLVATDSENHQTRIPLTSALPSLTTAHVIYHLDVFQNRLLTYDNGAKQRILELIERIYGVTLPIAAILAAALLLFHTLRAVVRRRPSMSPVHVLSVAVCAGGGSLIAILAVLTVSYSAGLNAEYLAGFVPLMLLGLSVAIAYEVALAARFIAAKRSQTR